MTVVKNVETVPFELKRRTNALVVENELFLMVTDGLMLTMLYHHEKAEILFMGLFLTV